MSGELVFEACRCKPTHLRTYSPTHPLGETDVCRIPVGLVEPGFHRAILAGLLYLSVYAVSGVTFGEGEMELAGDLHAEIDADADADLDQISTPTSIRSRRRGGPRAKRRSGP